MNEKCTTDQDNGMAERHKEQPVQANVCDVDDLIHSQKTRTFSKADKPAR